MDSPRFPFLADADRTFTAATEQFESLVASLDEDRANWSPDEKTWSVAACIDHLATTSETYFVHLDPAIERGHERGLAGEQPYGRGTWVGRLLLGTLDPERAKFKAVGAPRAFRPQQGTMDFAAVCDRFRQVQLHWHTLLRRADGLALGRITLATPVSRFLKLTAAQAILLNVYHEPRHLAQAERLTRLPQFPA